jgi:hypothetical protein
VKIPGTIVCDAEGCTYKLDVEDLGEHMDAACPVCGEFIMDESSKRAYATLRTLAEVGVIEPRPRGKGDLTLNSRGDWAAQLQSAFSMREKY